LPEVTRIGGASDERRTLAALLERSRFEVIPMGGIEDLVRAHVPAGSTITVTCSPGKGPDRTIDLAERLHASGYDVMPHVSARTVRGRDHLQEILGRLDAAGIDRLFAIGGDGHDPQGPYASALDLLHAIGTEDRRPSGIGIGGYPEGHPLIDDRALQEALEAKAPLASHVATQICFDPPAIARWIARIREAGVTLPVFLGMAGAVNRRKLIEVSLRVGVGPSVKYVSKYGSLVARLMKRGGYRPDAFVTQIEPFVENPEYGIAGFHVFTFNQVESTEAWRRGVVGAYRAARRPIADLADEDTAS
jgi:methylenetetrahydrofolate reductase (NADPH)